MRHFIWSGSLKFMHICVAFLISNPCGGTLTEGRLSPEYNFSINIQRILIIVRELIIHIYVHILIEFYWVCIRNEEATADNTNSRFSFKLGENHDLKSLRVPILEVLYSLKYLEYFNQILVSCSWNIYVTYLKISHSSIKYLIWSGSLEVMHVCVAFHISNPRRNGSGQRGA